MPDGQGTGAPARRPLDPDKFRDPARTLRGEERARVPFDGLRTLWFNTGTLCNIACVGCYIDSSPTNDRLAYIGRDDVVPYLDEIAERGLPTAEIGFTGGEPFINRALPAILEETLGRGFRALVLTNAMQPLWTKRQALLALKERHGARLVLRVSVDHHTAAGHERLRGAGTWTLLTRGLGWLAENGFALAVAGRTVFDETEADSRAGYARLFRALGLALDARDPAALVLFPEMDETADVPEITTACWTILGRRPESVMCATSRMVVRRKGAERPVVVACTLVPHDPGFECGRTLRDAERAVALNHPHCARFCVLGGASCSAG